MRMGLTAKCTILLLRQEGRGGILETFQDWLRTELQRSGMSYREVARKGGISGPRISQVLNGENPGTDFCVGIARGLGLPPDVVLQRAGILPLQPEQVPEEQQALSLFRRLEVEFRQSMIATMQNLLGIRTRSGSNIAVDPQPPERNRLSQRLAEELSTMPPEDQQLVFDLMRRLRGGGGDSAPDVATD